VLVGSYSVCIFRLNGWFHYATGGMRNVFYRSVSCQSVMKKIIIIYFCLLISPLSWAQPEFLLTSTNAGFFRRTMDKEKALEIANKNYDVHESVINLEGEDFQIFEVYKDTELLLNIEPYCDSECEIWRIWVYSKRFMTDKGIGIGNTIEDILKKYDFEYIATGEGNVSLKVKELDLGFMLDQTLFPKTWWEDGAKFKDIPTQTKITMIIL